MSELESETPERKSPEVGEEHFPGPMAAFGLALAGLLSSSLVASIAMSLGFSGKSSLMAAMGIGYGIGLGGVATLAAQRVPEPQMQRMGLQNFSPTLMSSLLCMLPLLILISELDNWWKLTLPVSPEFEEVREQMKALFNLNSPYAMIQTAIVALGIIPVVEGFFFFGVILQGVVGRLGRGRGLLVVAILYSLVHFPASGTPGNALIPLTTWLAVGGALGLVRLASGSILPAILLSSGYSAIHLIADVGRESFPIPGFNAPGDHTPLWILLPSAALVWVGAKQLWTEALRQPMQIPIPEQKDDLDEGFHF
jgi:membrane protease YdiL (CAAX protease family)